MATSLKPVSLFISDLHLNAERPDITRAFLHFCQTQASGVQALYILGDLSDAWVGDDDDSAIAGQIRQALKQLSNGGTEVFVMTGNRDFLIGQQFADDCACSLVADPTVIDLYGRATLLMHGDSLCTGDSEYMAFRAQIQDPDMQKILLDQSLAERRQIARQLRETSRSANASKASDIMDVTPEEVVKIMSANDVTTLIHGHTHRPAIHDLTLPAADQQLPDAKRYVLGDWDTLGWYIRASKDELTLESFDITGC